MRKLSAPAIVKTVARFVCPINGQTKIEYYNLQRKLLCAKLAKLQQHSRKYREKLNQCKICKFYYL